MYIMLSYKRNEYVLWSGPNVAWAPIRLSVNTSGLQRHELNRF